MFTVEGMKFGSVLWVDWLGVLSEGGGRIGSGYEEVDF